ncbi:cupin domain-containing protein [Solilutibacter silvestris]|uniref:Cupin domain-containing protein n=1 Tax=Solilutibacter silvestris TaxID=1645665 RepID=A0A2K1Q057_9GAMM|nr:cupin domain-containing protein [Lysobacter silvestris]PNS08421.1 Cupin domain-containing protein [Lysobacter silvestris]
MKFSYRATLLALALVGVAAPINATPPAEHMAMHANALQWGDAPPGLPKGAKLAVLSGNPGADGLFTIRLKMPPGYRIPRHTHPTDEAVTVIQGHLDYSMGDAASAHAGMLGANDFVNMPAGMQHAVSSKGGAIVQVQAMGPFQINYVNPADDPRGMEHKMK